MATATNITTLPITPEPAAWRDLCDGVTRRTILAASPAVAVSVTIGGVAIAAELPSTSADDELVRLWDQFIAARNGLRDAPHGSTDADHEVFYVAMDNARDRIAAIEPEGIAGIEVKLRLFWHTFADTWHEHYYGATATSDPQVRLLWSLIKRCEALATLEGAGAQS